MSSAATTEDPRPIDVALDEPMPRAPVLQLRRATDHAPGKLSGKVAVITDGDSPVARAVALTYAREGADVAVVYGAHEVEARAMRDAALALGRRCLLFRGDVGDAAFCRDAVSQIALQLGHLDVLVSHAAVHASVDDVERLSAVQLERAFRTNLFGYLLMVKACLPHLGAGSAILVTDDSATQGPSHALTRSLAQQLAPRGIRVNAIAPGSAKGRPAPPDEMAPAYVFFASADSSLVTGHVLAALSA